MTRNSPLKCRKNSAAAASLLILFLIFLLLKNPSVAKECVSRALSLSASALIPSLFPFMVRAEILVSCGFGSLFGQTLGRPVAALFGISREGSAALCLGALCGFPVGARMALSLYDGGRITKQECERLLSLASFPSIAFLLSTVGGALYQSPRFGRLLWLSCLTSSLVLGLATRKKGASLKVAPSYSLPPLDVKIFPTAIAKATGAMLSITAYVVFFGAIVGTLAQVLEPLALPEVCRALLFGFFELSSGVSAAASLESHALSALLCALTVGWSGLSIHCQLLTLCDGRDLSLRFYFRARAAEAILCAAMAMIFAPFCF